jgi:xanthine/CO dehydrogenase XdhC/CoxF family maturation factor
MGLDLGAEAPEGIALSVLAEVQAVIAGRSDGHLRDRQAPIHG